MEANEVGISINELRVGNYVSISNNIVIFDSGDFADAYYNHNGISDYMDYIKPIQLTEDWLVKFGFEKPKFCGFYQSDYIVELNDRFVINDRKDGFFYVDAPNLCIESVHQLQNLYFALTGEELTIKNK